jgi:ABC-type lipoprotein export system ATPase subunit
MSVRKSRSATLVIVTHDPSVAAIADAQLVLRDGRSVDQRVTASAGGAA